MSEWKENKINDICELIVDCVNRTAPVVDYTTDFKMIRTTNVRNGKIDTINVRCVSEETYKIWTRRGKPIVDDIILTREAPVGEVGRITKDENIFLGQRTMMYRANKKIINPHFLFYSFFTSNVREQILSTGMGSVVEHIRVPDAKEFIIKYPSLPEQKVIASTLSSIDDKIDLLHRQNATLEAMAETLFRQWFLEEAKEDWGLVKLVDYVVCFNGVSYKSEDLNPSKTAMVTLKSFDRNGGFRLDGFKEYTGRYKEQHIVKEGNLAVAHTDITQDADVIGNPILVISNPQYDTMVISMDLVKVVSKYDWLSNEFLYFLMKTREFKEHCLGCSNGSTVLHLNKIAIPSFEFYAPKKEKAIKFTSVAKPIIDKQFKNQAQIRTLTTLRDTLLPKLMSGELRVSL